MVISSCLQWKCLAFQLDRQLVQALGFHLEDACSGTWRMLGWFGSSRSRPSAAQGIMLGYQVSG